jgi:phospholipase C
VVYDEHGGFYGHVVPPPAIPPDDRQEEWTFDRLGVRVPALLISPWVGARVEKTQFDHTSLLKYLTNKWGLGDLGRRTATANSVGITLVEGKARENTVPFVRVPYSTLIPSRPDLEQEDSSTHHAALQKFAEFLAEKEDAGTIEVVKILAGTASWWARSKAGIGKIFLKAGAGLTRPTTSERYSGYLLGHFRPWLMQLGQENTPGNTQCTRSTTKIIDNGVMGFAARTRRQFQDLIPSGVQ